MINITQGNDVKLYATFTLDGYEYALTTVTAVRLISRIGRRVSLSFSYDDTQGHLTITVPATVPAGVYALEITGTEGDDQRRVVLRNAIALTAYTTKGDYDNADDADTHDVVVHLTLISFESPLYITAIADSAYAGRLDITKAYFPRVITIGGYAFYQCSALASASFPSATNIDSSAFYSCSALASVSLPSVTSIGSSVFSGCPNLTALILGTTPPASTGGLTTACTVYVPDTAVSKYQSATAWKSYTIKPWSALPDELKVEE